MTRQAQSTLEFGPYRLDAEKRLLSRSGEVVPLTPKCFEILVVLVENSGEIVDKEVLMKRVWPDSFVEEGNLTYNISMLRKALGERANEHLYIVTVPGRGYQFVTGVSEAFPQDEQEIEPAPFESEGMFKKSELAQDETEVETRAPFALSPVADDVQVHPRLEPGNKAVRTRRRAFVGAAAVTMVAIIAAAAYLLYRPGSQTNPSSIAVLPFSNGSGNPDLEYLSDGISESLIDSLSRLPGVKVIARASSFKYKGKYIDPREVARELGVDAIVTGRVAQLGDNLLISTELMNARDNTQIWAEQYNRKAPNLVSVPSEISGEIARTLRLKLNASQQQQVAKGEAVNPQAYELLLRGRFHYYKGGKNQKKGVDYYLQAIAVDPDYAPAYAALSVSYSDFAHGGAKEFGPKAEAAARKALELDERLAEAHAAMALIKSNAWEWAAAEQEYQRAVELNPNLAAAFSGYAFHLALVGRHEKADAAVMRARELDPLSPVVTETAGFLQMLARQYDQAIVTLKGLLELYPDRPLASFILADAYLAKGMFPEAIAGYQRLMKLAEQGPVVQIYLGAAYAKAGKRGQAQAILKRLETSGSYVSPGELPVLYVALGEREKAFASLERAYAEHDAQLQFLGVEPGFDPLRGDPRFTDLMRRVGLSQ